MTRAELAAIARDRRDFAKELIVGPELSEVIDRRCPECGDVRPLGYRRTIGTLAPGNEYVLPVEYRCDRCKAFAPRVRGDEIDLDDPAVATVTMICQYHDPRPVIWRRRSYGTIYTAPAEANTMTRCPRCTATNIGQMPYKL